jgi:hypothetical protein
MTEDWRAITLQGETVIKRESGAHSDPRWGLVERIAESQHLKSSQRLCQFLLYVADCAVRVAPEDATEQQIGIRVFGRPPGYNSSEDSIVRTHARLLRQKLELYFAQEGAREEILLEIPKGHYLPNFLPRPGKIPAPHGTKTMPVERQESAPFRVRNSRLASVSVALLLAALATVGVLVWHPWNRLRATESAVDTFWHPFLTGEPPIVIFSNALFTGDSTNGLRYAEPEESNSTIHRPIVDTYTGIGELSSVYSLTRLFDAHQTTFILKRSLLVTWDEAEMRNLIFIGSRAENPSLRVLPGTTDFTMVAAPDSAGIVNHTPKAGEPALYSRPEHPLSSDYAILALLPGVQPGKRILIFSGLTTFGTQAAVDYVCRPETAGELLKKITGPKGEIQPFEAVLQTTIAGGVPMNTRLFTVHLH